MSVAAVSQPAVCSPPLFEKPALVCGLGVLGLPSSAHGGAKSLQIAPLGQSYQWQSIANSKPKVLQPSRCEQQPSTAGASVPAGAPAHSHAPLRRTSEITKRIRAATCIQAHWRGHSVRARLRPRIKEQKAVTVVAPREPSLSYFSQCGRPAIVNLPKPRVWWGLKYPRSRLDVRIPRTEADVPMSEVERILQGGFWRHEAPVPPERADEGLSFYKREQMKQQEREQEEALQLLAYEPTPELQHKLIQLGSSLSKSLGKTLAAWSSLPKGFLFHGQDSDSQQQQQQQAQGSMQMQGWRAPCAQAAGTQRTSHRQAQAEAEECEPLRPLLFTRQSENLQSLKLPLNLHDLESGQHELQGDADARAGPVPIAINPQRYRSRSMLSRSNSLR